jgi:integrase
VTLASVPATSPAGLTDQLELLLALVSEDFWAAAGWDPQLRLVQPPPEHPVLGWPQCVVPECTVRSYRSGTLCNGCRVRQARSGLPVEEFVGDPQVRHQPIPHRRLFDETCLVPRCPRPQQTAKRGLCNTHQSKAREWFGAVNAATVQKLLGEPDVGPLLPWGDCRVAACTRLSEGAMGLCIAHRNRWRADAAAGTTDLAAWCRVEPGIARSGMVNLRGLPDLVVAQVLVAVQRRAEQGFKISPETLEAVVRHVRCSQRPSLAQVGTGTLAPGYALLLGQLQREARRACTTWDDEQATDIWDLGMIGLPGVLDFTGITQQWLRQAIKTWIAEDLPKRRGTKTPYSVSRCHIASIGQLSRSLHLQRADHGADPAALGRADILAFLTRLGHLRTAGQFSPGRHLQIVRHTRTVLTDCRDLGLGHPGRCLADLPGEFAVRPGDLPAGPAERRPSRALPPAVMQQLDQALPQLEQRFPREFRVAVELLMDTGRRPDEICRLPWHCLEHDGDGKAVLVYTDFKRNQLGRRLPIADSTARLIRAQQRYARQRYPNTAEADLVLLPATAGNAHGAKSIRATVLTGVHREWVDGIGAFTLEDGTPFPAAAVVPYAYRHSFAQRHADAGTPIDVLRDLMAHRSTYATQGYYRITEKRTRAAVERLAQHQYDGAGQRLWRELTGVMDSERARMRVGQVAVPFGICAEPSNVKAGGGACPYRLRCLGCGHFRTDASYLPDLRGYLDRLLADRERVLATTDLADWAKAEAAPSTTEIDKVRALIRRLEAGLDDLSVEESQHIDEACSVLRKTRQAVSLGMPTVPAAHIDVRTIGRTS